METTPLRLASFLDQFGFTPERLTDRLAGRAVDGGDGIRVPTGPSLRPERGTRA